MNDLNNVKSTTITIDDTTTINLRLFPRYPSPPEVYSFQVPILIRDLSEIVNDDWDLTMQKVQFI